MSYVAQMQFNQVADLRTQVAATKTIIRPLGDAIWNFKQWSCVMI